MATPFRQELASVPRTMAGHEMQVQSTKLARVSLRNFKGHEDLRLGMGTITVLTGPTSSGKSTVLQALNLLRSALQAGDLGMLGGGGSPEHGRFADIVARGDESLDIGIGVGGHRRVGAGEDGCMAADFSYDVSFGASLRPSMVHATVDARRDPPPPQPGEGAMRVEHVYGEGPNATSVSGSGAVEEPPVSVPAGGGLAPRIDLEPAGRSATGAFRRMFGGGQFFRSLLDGLWHVPFSRVAAPWLLPSGRDGDFLPPDRSRGAASLASRIGGNLSIQGKISDMMREMGLGRIATRSAPAPEGGEPAPALDIVGKDTFRSMVREGSGPDRLVRMLAMLACSPRGAVVTIEEPEMHLDPAAQARLMGILVRQATEGGKQIVFTTHSDHLLYPLLAYVAKDGCPLACGDVAMHYFNADESGGLAGAERLPINRHGQIPGGLKGFWNADGRAMRAVLG